MKNNNIRMNIKYIMNFSPKYLNSQINLSLKKNTKIYCRNFIFTILAFDLFKSQNLHNKYYPFKYSFFILKNRKHYGSHLRAPYKNKSTQFSLGIIRYFLIVSIHIFNTSCLRINSSSDFFNLYSFLLNYNYFESSLVTQSTRSLNLPIIIKIL